jgi:hypothetical protein
MPLGNKTGRRDFIFVNLFQGTMSIFLQNRFCDPFFQVTIYTPGGQASSERRKQVPPGDKLPVNASMAVTLTAVSPNKYGQLTKR